MHDMLGGVASFRRTLAREAGTGAAFARTERALETVLVALVSSRARARCCPGTRSRAKRSGPPAWSRASSGRGCSSRTRSAWCSQPAAGGRCSSCSSAARPPALWPLLQIVLHEARLRARLGRAGLRRRRAARRRPSAACSRTRSAATPTRSSSRRRSSWASCITVRRRAKDGARPILIAIHGGSWQHGGPRENADFTSHFANAGWAVFSLEYRLAPQFVHPAQIDDVRRSIVLDLRPRARARRRPRADRARRALRRRPPRDARRLHERARADPRGRQLLRPRISPRSGASACCRTR